MLGLDSFIILDPVNKLIQKQVSFNTKKEAKQNLFNKLIAYDGTYVDKVNYIQINTGSLWSRKEVHRRNLITKFILQLNTATYIPFTPITVNTYSFSLDFSGPSNPMIILRPDHSNSIFAIGLNSIHKYYCQILMVSAYTNYGNSYSKFYSQIYSSY